MTNDRILDNTPCLALTSHLKLLGA